MNDSEVLIEGRDGITVVTLNRPDKLNRLSAAVQEGILQGLKSSLENGSRVIVIKGSGRAFSTGYDLDVESRGRKAYLSLGDINDDRAGLQRAATTWLAVRRHPIPVVTQVHGYCLAGGTDLMLASDIAIAADDAIIGMPNTRSLGVTLMLPALVWACGSMRSKLMAFTGDSISGRVAAAWSLVALSVPADELDKTVAELAERIARVPVELLIAAKRTLNWTHEAAGLEQAVSATVDIDAVAHFTAPVRSFWELARESGLKVALRGRDDPFDSGNFMRHFEDQE